MNNVSLIGRWVKQPELKYIPGSGTAVANGTLAVDKGLSKSKKEELKAQGKPTADFPRITIWGKVAENTCNYGYKGQLVAISGSIRTSTSKDDQGNTNYYTDVNAYKVDFLEWEDDKTSNKKGDEINPDDFASVEDDDDIPF